MAQICFAKEPVLEYKESVHTLLIDKKRMYIKSDKSYWLFPGIPKRINIGLELYIPDTCIGLLTKSIYLSPNIQLDTRTIHDMEGIPSITVVNRGWLPTKLSDEKIIAELTIFPKKECHIVNLEGLS